MTSVHIVRNSQLSNRYFDHSFLTIRDFQSSIPETPKSILRPRRVSSSPFPTIIGTLKEDEKRNRSHKPSFHGSSISSSLRKSKGAAADPDLPEAQISVNQVSVRRETTLTDDFHSSIPIRVRLCYEAVV